MANTAPRKLRIMRWLTTHLEATTGPSADNGPADALVMTDKVYRGRSVFSDEEIKELGVDEFISILEGPRPSPGDFGGDQYQRNDKNWSLLVQGWIKDDKKHPSDPAYWLEAAVLTRLARIIALEDGEPRFPDDFRMGGLIADLYIGQSVVRPPPQGITRYGMFYVPLKIQLVTNVLQPYD